MFYSLNVNFADLCVIVKLFDEKQQPTTYKLVY